MNNSITLIGDYNALVDDEDRDLLPDARLRRRPRKNTYVLAKGGGNMHRIIMGRILGRELETWERVDHRNLNKRDNRRENLRLATHGQNIANQDKKRHSGSAFKGATKASRTSWLSQIKFDGRHMRLGLFDTAIEAHRAYCIAALKYHAPFHNFGSNSPFLGWSLIDLERGYKQLELPLFQEAA